MYSLVINCYNLHSSSFRFLSDAGPHDSGCEHEYIVPAAEGIGITIQTQGVVIVWGKRSSVSSLNVRIKGEVH